MCELELLTMLFFFFAMGWWPCQACFVPSDLTCNWCTSGAPTQLKLIVPASEFTTDQCPNSDCDLFNGTFICDEADNSDDDFCNFVYDVGDVCGITSGNSYHQIALIDGGAPGIGGTSNEVTIFVRTGIQAGGFDSPPAECNTNGGMAVEYTWHSGSATINCAAISATLSHLATTSGITDPCCAIAETTVDVENV